MDQARAILGKALDEIAAMEIGVNQVEILMHESLEPFDFAAIPSSTYRSWRQGQAVLLKAAEVLEVEYDLVNHDPISQALGKMVAAFDEGQKEIQRINLGYEKTQKNYRPRWTGSEFRTRGL